jgi:hypothetical protein
LSNKVNPKWTGRDFQSNRLFGQDIHWRSPSFGGLTARACGADNP